MSIEVIVLGRAQDAGVPQAGCKCGHCLDARAGKAPREHAASLAVFDRESCDVWFIDVGPDFREQLAYIEHLLAGTRIAGIFITHAHMGHYVGLMHLGKEAMNALQVPVFGSTRLSEFLRKNAPWSQLVALKNISLRECDSSSSVILNHRLRIEFVPVPHRGEFSDTVAFIIHGPSRALFYCPDIDDWENWTRDVRKLPDEFDISIIDGTFFSGDELSGRDISQIPHPTVHRTMQLIGNGRGKVFFTHLNHTNPLLASAELLQSLKASGFGVVEAKQSFSL